MTWWWLRNGSWITKDNKTLGLLFVTENGEDYVIHYAQKLFEKEIPQKVNKITVRPAFWLDLTINNVEN